MSGQTPEAIGWQNPGDRFEFTFHLGTGPWATPEVTLPADGVFWDAQMTAFQGKGQLSGLLGGLFNLGSITPNSFSFLNEDYTVEDLFRTRKTTGPMTTQIRQVI